MKKYLFILLITSVSFGQSSIGFIDNYSGINSVSFNPANIADSFHKFDIHLFSTDLNVGNTVTSVNPFPIIGDISLKENKFKEATDYFGKEDFSTNSSVYGNATFLGPSFMWSLDRSTAVGFTSAVRTNGSVLNYNTKLYDLLNHNKYLDHISELKKLETDQFKGKGNVFSWAEVGFSYAKVLKHTSTEIFKVGGSLKFLKGFNSFSASLENIDASFDLDLVNPIESDINLKGTVDITNSVEGTNYGQGLDIGFVYEKRTKTLPYALKDNKGVYYAKAPYAYKLSVSITDIGFLSFNNVKHYSNVINYDFPKDDLETEEFFRLNGFTHTSKQTYVLPTTAHLNFDYHLHKNWFVNSNLDLYLLSNKNINNLKTISTFTISPRYESKNISAFLPFSVNRFGVFKGGLGFRTGYFFLGSSSFFTNLTNFSKEGNLYVGIKMPIYNKKRIKEFKRSFKNYELE